MKNLIAMLAIMLSLFASAQERMHCVLNATTNPYETPSIKQIENKY